MAATIGQLFLLKDQTVPLLPVTEYASGAENTDPLWMAIKDIDWSTSDDLLELLKESNIDSDIAISPNETVAGDVIGQDASIPGAEKAKGSFAVNMGGGILPTGPSAYTEPYFGKLLRILSSFKLTPTPASQGVVASLLYQPDKQSTAGLCAHFTGAEPENAGHVLRLFANLQAGWTIDIKAGEPAKITFDVNGAYIGAVDLTLFSGLAYPSVSKKGWKINSVKKSQFMFMDQVVPFSAIQIKGNQPAAATEDGTAAGGVGIAEMSDRKISMDITYRAASVATDSSKHPASILKAGTIGAFKIGWGASNAVTISSSYCQITKAEHADVNGLLNYKATAIFIGNDLSILITAILAAAAVPAAPVLLQPSADATGVLVNNINFSWMPAPGAVSYDLQMTLGTDTEFAAPIVDLSGITGLSEFVNLDTPLANNTAYIWRMRAVNAVGNGEYGTARTFTTEEGEA